MTPLRYLAALACGRRPDPSGVDAPVDDVLTLAGRLGLVSLLGDALAEAGHREARRAVASGLLLAARRDRLFALLRSLVGAGAHSGILIKGGALVLTGRLEHRDMVDLDVVVPASAIDSWSEAAASVGATWQSGRGYDAGAITHPDGLLEIHRTLPGFVGSESGPSWETLDPHAVASPLPDIRVPAAHVAREITVQHFAFHHAGETDHALRVLQDLAALEDEPDGEGLDWGRAGVRKATASMRAIVRQIRDGHDTEGPANDYLVALEGALASDARTTFADDVERWIADKPGALARARLVARRVFPPLEEMRESENESPARTAARYLSRPFALASRFLGTRRPHGEREKTWDAVIEGLKER